MCISLAFVLVCSVQEEFACFVLDTRDICGYTQPGNCYYVTKDIFESQRK